MQKKGEAGVKMGEALPVCPFLMKSVFKIRFSHPVDINILNRRVGNNVGLNSQIGQSGQKANGCNQYCQIKTIVQRTCSI